MSSNSFKTMLGCAQNPDGSLKDANEIPWSHSRSPSPNLLSMKGNAVPEASNQKAKGKKKLSHPRRSITSAITGPSITQK